MYGDKKETGFALLTCCRYDKVLQDDLASGVTEHHVAESEKILPNRSALKKILQNTKMIVRHIVLVNAPRVTKKIESVTVVLKL